MSEPNHNERDKLIHLVGFSPDTKLRGGLLDQDLSLAEAIKYVMSQSPAERKNCIIEIGTRRIDHSEAEAIRRRPDFPLD
jgi:hypothetical protein